MKGTKNTKDSIVLVLHKVAKLVQQPSYGQRLNTTTATLQVEILIQALMVDYLEVTGTPEDIIINYIINYSLIMLPLQKT